MKRFIENSSAYTKSVVHKYASKQEQKNSTRRSYDVREPVNEKNSDLPTGEEELDQEAVSSEAGLGPNAAHEHADSFFGQVTRNISGTGSKISASVTGIWSKITGTSAGAATPDSGSEKPKEAVLAKRTVVSDAKNAASIVSDGIESGDYAGIDTKLQEIIEFDEQRAEYVFPFGSVVADFIFIAVCVVFSAAFLYLQLFLNL